LDVQSEDQLVQTMRPSMLAVVFELTLKISPFGNVICFGQRRSAHQTQRMRYKELFETEQLSKKVETTLKANVVSVCPPQEGVFFSDTPAVTW